MAKLLSDMDEGASSLTLHTDMSAGGVGLEAYCAREGEVDLSVVVACDRGVAVAWLRACLREIEGDGGRAESSDQTRWCACESCAEKLAIVDHWWGRADAGTLLSVLAMWGVNDVHVHVVHEDGAYPREVCVNSDAVEMRRIDDTSIPRSKTCRGSLIGKGATHAAAIRAACENGVAWRAAGGGGDA